MLSRRLVIAFLAGIIPSTLLLSTVTVYSLVTLERVNRDLVEITQSREAVAELHLTLTQAGGPLGAFLLSGDQRNRRRFEELIDKAETKLQSCGSSACHGSAQVPGRMAATLKPVVERLKTEGRLVFEEGPGAGTARVEVVRESIAGMHRAIRPMLDTLHTRGDLLVWEAGAVRRRAWLLTASITAVIILAGCVAASVIARRISRPLSDLVFGIRRVMSGDWSYQAVSGPGEIGELASSFNRMIHDLRHNREILEEQNRTLEERVRQRTEELRHKEQALLQSEKLASLGLLAAGVAHELNNPLTSIVMNTHLLIEEVGAGTPLHAELEKIDADAGRCRRIIDDLRAFARLRQIEKGPTDIGKVIEQAVRATAHEFARRKIDAVCELADDLPKVNLDPDRMVQVLVNLLVNAAQATDDGGRVIVRAYSEQSWLAIEVRDSGPGIPAAHRTRIFDPFFTTKREGTGLGLSISYGLVNEHGGRIEVDSHTLEEVEAGGRPGTTVRVFLPLGEVSP